MLPLLYTILLDITFAVHNLPDICTCSRSILLDVTFAAPLFYWILHLQCTNLLDIALAVHQFHQILLLLHHYCTGFTLQCTNFTRYCAAADQFTRCCLCCTTILLDYYTCSVLILLDIALAADQFY